MSNLGPITTIFIGLAVGLVFFLVIRELVCWYSKINERISLQKRTNYLLELIFEQLGGKFETENKDENSNEKPT